MRFLDEDPQTTNLWSMTPGQTGEVARTANGQLDGYCGLHIMKTNTGDAVVLDGDTPGTLISATSFDYIVRVEEYDMVRRTSDGE